MAEKKKVTDLPLVQSLVGLYTIGVDAANNSVRVSLEWLKTAYDNVTAAISKADRATESANTAAGKADRAATDAGTVMVQISANVSQVIGETNKAKDAANAAAGVALNVATHPTYIGPDNYVYEWDLETQQYVKTNVSAKGDTGLKGDKGDKGETGDRGLQGLKGDKGDQGEQGLKGDKGDQGIQGEKGDKGNKGDTGSGFAVLGYFNTLGDLEAAVPSPNTGDAYGVGLTDPYDIYIYDAVNSTWVNNGPLQGAQGIQGEKGDKGDQGERGLKGDPGAKGDKGDKGDTGATGSQGIQGLKGDKGDKGDTGEQGIKGDKGDPGQDSAIPVDAPADGKTYGRKDAGWSEVVLDDSIPTIPFIIMYGLSGNPGVFTPEQLSELFSSDQYSFDRMRDAIKAGKMVGVDATEQTEPGVVDNDCSVMFANSAYSIDAEKETVTIIFQVLPGEYTLEVNRTLQGAYSATCTFRKVIDLATTNTDGLMSSADKRNLDAAVVPKNVTTATTLTNLSIANYSIKVTLSSASALSFASTPAEGWECMIDIKNVYAGGGGSITQPLPNASGWQCDDTSVTIAAGKIASISVRYIHNTYVVIAKGN